MTFSSRVFYTYPSNALPPLYDSSTSDCHTLTLKKKFSPLNLLFLKRFHFSSIVLLYFISSVLCLWYSFIIFSFLQLKRDSVQAEFKITVYIYYEVLNLNYLKIRIFLLTHLFFSNKQPGFINFFAPN